MVGKERKKRAERAEGREGGCGVLNGVEERRSFSRKEKNGRVTELQGYPRSYLLKNSLRYITITIIHSRTHQASQFRRPGNLHCTQNFTMASQNGISKYIRSCLTY